MNNLKEPRQETVKHTPLPWRAFNTAGPTMQGYSQSSGIVSEEHRDQLIAGCFKDIGGEELAAENAAFIVRAVNSHYELLEALTQVTACLVRQVHSVLPGFPESQMDVAPGKNIESVRQLITKATGGL